MMRWLQIGGALLLIAAATGAYTQWKRALIAEGERRELERQWAETTLAFQEAKGRIQARADSLEVAGEALRLRADSLELKARADSARFAQSLDSAQIARERAELASRDLREAMNSLLAAGVDSALVAGIRVGVETLETDSRQCSVALADCQRLVGSLRSTVATERDRLENMRRQRDTAREDATVTQNQLGAAERLIENLREIQPSGTNLLPWAVAGVSIILNVLQALSGG